MEIICPEGFKIECGHVKNKRVEGRKEQESKERSISMSPESEQLILAGYPGGICLLIKCSHIELVSCDWSHNSSIYCIMNDNCRITLQKRSEVEEECHDINYAVILQTCILTAATGLGFGIFVITCSKLYLIVKEKLLLQKHPVCLWLCLISYRNLLWYKSG